MRLSKALKTSAALFAVSLAPLVAHAQSPASPAPAPAIVAPAAENPAPAPAPAPRVMNDAAAAYAGYQSDVSAVRAAPLASAAQLDSALNTFGGHNALQLSGGWIAYSAMIASRNSEFANAVRDIDAAYGRDRVMLGMRNDVGYARTLKGAEDALQTSLAANAQDSGRISSAAAFVKEQAYKLQDVAWGKTRLPNAAETARQLKVSSTTVRPLSDAARKLFSGGGDVVLTSAAASPGQSSVWDRLATITTGASGVTLAAITPVIPAKTFRIDPKREGTANRIVTLAAFHVLDAEQTNATAVRDALKDKPTNDCIDWAQTQLRACVSAAYTRADLSFCLAEHAIGDSGACFSSVAR